MNRIICRKIVFVSFFCIFAMLAWDFLGFIHMAGRVDLVAQQPILTKILKTKIKL